jgi:hypothetical protein
MAFVLHSRMEPGCRSGGARRNAMNSLDRRHVLKGGAAALAAGPLLSVEARGQSKTTVNMQLGWIVGGNQVGEVCAKALGYYEQEGLELKIQAGGPNIDGVAVVASGRYEVGQVSSSPSLMLAASQDIRSCASAQVPRSTLTPSSPCRESRSANLPTWPARRSAFRRRV